MMRIVEEALGCKWSLEILNQVRRGVHRPGALARSLDGLSTKVLNDRLGEFVRYGLLEKRSYPEIPPHVEYTLTDFGRRFVDVLDSIEQLQREVSDPEK
ncbi:gsl3590 [Gloeobacter violaceus PCC 7421]|uniref:Gsl3590 protein n=2 Tax=Gloeobacter violaceus TaxID=33072 RepID=Q7NFD6_GLOVI|nr:gsl3590 [Gloeobacter violaceus PCC 7421]